MYLFEIYIFDNKKSMINTGESTHITSKTKSNVISISDQNYE